MPIAYPHTRADDFTEELHGHSVPDPTAGWKTWTARRCASGSKRKMT
jgi:hypothetical protein